MSPEDRRQTGDLRRELEPNILPRQLRALEVVAARLERARPAPEPRFRAALGEELEALAAGSGRSRGRPARWLAPALGAVALGVLLLAIAAALAL